MLSSVLLPLIGCSTSARFRFNAAKVNFANDASLSPGAVMGIGDVRESHNGVKVRNVRLPLEKYPLLADPFLGTS